VGKGFLFGICFGAMFAALSLSAVSLMGPPVGSRLQFVQVAEPVSQEMMQAEQAALPDQPADDGVTSADVTPAETKTDTPEVAIVDVPAGSEFARPKSEQETVVPGTEPVTLASELPEVTAPDAETTPQLADLSPAAIPEGQAVAPDVIPAPEPETPEMSVANLDLGPTAATVPPGQAPVLETSSGVDNAVPTVETPAPLSVASSVDSVETGEAAAMDEPAPLANVEVTVENEPAEIIPQPIETASVVVETPATVPVVEETSEAEMATEAISTLETPSVSTSVPTTLAQAEPVTESIAAPEPESRVAQAQAVLPETTPIILDPAPQKQQSADDAPIPGFSEAVAGVKVNRLPTIGTAPDEEAPAPEADTGLTPDQEIDLATLPAIVRYAAAFERPEGRALLSVVILDVGVEEGGLEPAALAVLGLPVTIAVSPSRSDAANRAAIYRAAGLEVAILAPELPTGATASDLEVSYQSFVSSLPETMAVIGQPDAQFQTNRRTAQHLASLLSADGRGLISYSRGLNPAGQEAEKVGVAHAAVYRELDNDHENAGTISRYLDRAAFEADQKGQVLVLGHSYPATIAALNEWAVAGAKGTAIAPASAVMITATPLN